MTRILLPSFLLFPTLAYSQGIDLDGNGLGDLWSAHYGANALQAHADDDGDGASNREEAITGTNPLDATSVFLADISPSGDQWRLSWVADPNKSYQIESSSDMITWTPYGNAVENVSGSLHITLELTADRTFVQVRVSEVDRDQDGLTAWEEAGLGLSDLDPSSNRDRDRTDFPAAVSRVASPSSFTFRGKSQSGLPPTLAEAARFLQQATMGADYETIQSVASLGIPAWIEREFSKPITSHVLTNNQLTLWEQGDDNDLVPESTYIWTWWDAALRGNDLLRQRVAFALSEIFVIGQTTDILEDAFWGVATYYDILVEEAFGNYRDLLYRISTSPAMGHYLSHAKNRPTNSAQNLFPDENYAREIMQLFSIGLYQLNQDGTRKKDGNGNDIPTYTNAHITEFARVFTGLTYNPKNPNNGTPWYGDPDLQVIDSMDAYLEADEMWMGIEMAKYPSLHETGIKTLLYGQTTNGTLQQDLDAAIDNLFHHPNVGPFIGRLLIQRLVKSNPSPGYIYRVAAAFNDNGAGVRGDMKAVIRAILLDPEARNRGFIEDPTHGKLREPVLRHVHLARAFDIQTSNGLYRNDHYDALAAYGQRPMLSPSVFNFYLPDHQPLGELKAAGLKAPEFQITTATTTVKTLNYWSWAVPFDGLILPVEEDEVETRIDYSKEIALAHHPDALLDRLDLLLTRGQMAARTRTILKDSIQSLSSEAAPEDLVRFVVSLIASSPDFAVLR